MVAGVGSNLVWWVYVQGQRAAAVSSATASYTAPTLTGAALSSGPGTRLSTLGGANVLVLTGVNLGPMNATLNTPTVVYQNQQGLTYTPSASACSVSVAQTQVTCNAVAGVGTYLSFLLTVGLQPSPSFVSSVNYSLPVITGVTAPPTLGSLGGDLITLTGSSFGPTTTPVGQYVVTYGPGPSPTALTALSCSLSAPDTSVTCTSVAGVGANHQFFLTVATQRSSASGSGIVVSYTPPAITGVSGVAMPTPGGSVVTIVGTNFGPLSSQTSIWTALGATIVVTYGGSVGSLYTAAACNVSVAGTHIVCFSTAGCGAALQFVVDIDSQTSPLSAATVNLSYSLPAITSFDAGALSVPTVGSYVTMYGTNFGPISATAPVPTVVAATYGASPLGTTYTALNCNVTLADTRIGR